MKILIITLFVFCGTLKAQPWGSPQWNLTEKDTAIVKGIDLWVHGEGYKFRFFPAGQFVYVSTPEKSLTINSRGAGFSFSEGNLSLFSVFYDTQISGLSGLTGDSTLAGLNYVRFKGKGDDQFAKGYADQVDFDDASGFLRYDFKSGYVLAGKYPFASGPSVRNNLLFNHSTGDFPHLYFQWNKSVFKYEFLYGFMKHFNGRNSLSDKSMVWHQASVNWPGWLRLYLFEAVMKKGHQVEAEYLNPLLFLRSVDHYNFSPDNALLGAGVEFTFSGFRLYQEFLVDDLETAKLGSGWFRNKVAGLSGIEFNYDNEWFSSTTTGEVVWVLPFTYSHRTEQINLTHYGSQLGPELGPNSVKSGLYQHFHSKQLPLTAGWEVEFWVSGTTEQGSENVGDDVSVGHPEPPGNVAFADHVKLLSGKKVSALRLSGLVDYNWMGIRIWARPVWFSSDYITPSLAIKKGLSLEAGIRYELPYFDAVRPELW